MADFVNDAFTGAMNVAAEDEYKAYQRGVVDKIDEIFTAAGLMAGIDKMNELARIVAQSGQVNVLADFTKNVAIAAFHIGYNEGRNSL